MQATARPYPFHAWPRLTRTQTRLLQRLARALPPGDREALAREARELLGCELHLETRSLRATRGDRPLPPGPQVVAWLQNDEGAHAWLQLEPVLAGAVVDRVLGGDGTAGAGAALARVDDVSRGALAYVLARSCEAWNAGWRLAAVQPEHAVAQAETSLAEAPLECAFRVELGGLRGWAAIRLSEAALRTLRLRTAPSFRWLHGMRMQVSARAGLATLAAGEASTLQPGDTVVPDHCALEHTPEGWQGDVELSLEGSSRRSWRCRLEPGTLHVTELRAGRETPVREGNHMANDANDARDADTQLQTLAGDAPVELSVELARFSLPLETLAELRAGEVLHTARAVGEQVTLRAGGRAIAYGELVDVEGEVGVRVLELASTTR